jgi:hypothetical protein
VIIENNVGQVWLGWIASCIASEWHICCSDSNLCWLQYRHFM